MVFGRLTLFILQAYGTSLMTSQNSPLAGVQIRLTGVTEVSFRNMQGVITKRSKKLETEVITVVKNTVTDDKVVMSYCSHTCTYISFSHASDIVIDRYFQEYKVIRGKFAIHEDYPFSSSHLARKLKMTYFNRNLAEFNLNLYNLIENGFVQFFALDSFKKVVSMAVMYDYNNKAPLPPITVENKEFKTTSNTTSTHKESSRLEDAMRNLNIH